MAYLIYVFLFLLGTIFASFLIATSYRLNKEMKWKELFLGRSMCDSCNKTLHWYELIPIFSYIFLKGKCPKCKKYIPFVYTLSEIFLGIAFVLIYISWGINIWVYVIICILFSLSYFDYISKTIPAFLTNTLLVIGVVYFTFHFSSAQLITIGIGAGVCVFLLILNRIKESFGFGDIIVFLAFSFILPTPLFITFLLLSIYISAIFAIGLVIKNRKNLKTYIPLLPFITLAFLLTPFVSKYFVEYIFSLW
ncbi:prepilin peptidase [Candidatus Dojkabacteria bacterium]|jgi:leader peptidase (prepilin peptidase)/N-methyltransferase|nr:prepilin peptidase [Candidatus Dojkabacteria bacterium]